jgi:Holliday junction resolvase RusA-like endonuclease
MNQKSSALALAEALGLGPGLELPGGYSEKDVGRALLFAQEEELHNPAVTVFIEIPGEPPIAKRPRKNRDGTRVYGADGGEMLSLGQLIQLQLPKEPPFEGEARLDLAIYRMFPSDFPPYKRLLAELGYLSPAVKPDYDNYAKIITDSMTKRLFRDDGQIVIGNVLKAYNRRPRLEVTFTGRRHKYGRGKPRA